MLSKSLIQFSVGGWGYVPSLLFTWGQTIVAQLVKNPPAMQETWVRSLGWEDPLKGIWSSRRGRLPTLVFWPGEFHGLYSPWRCRESDTTERLSFQTMVEVMKIMVTSFKRSHAGTVAFSACSPAAGHHQPMPPPETPGHSRASLGQSLVGSLLLSSESWCTQDSVCALQELISQSCVSSGGSIVGLIVTFFKRAYAIPRSAGPRAPAPAAVHCWPVPPQETLKHSSVPEPRFERQVIPSPFSFFTISRNQNSSPGSGLGVPADPFPSYFPVKTKAELKTRSSGSGRNGQSPALSHCYVILSRVIISPRRAEFPNGRPPAGPDPHGSKCSSSDGHIPFHKCFSIYF